VEALADSTEVKTKLLALAVEMKYELYSYISIKKFTLVRIYTCLNVMFGLKPVSLVYTNAFCV